MKILLFGSSGMLGNYVKNYLLTFYHVICITRSDFDIELCEWYKLEDLIKSCDIIINCAGAIPQQKCDIRKYIILNTIFPHKVSDISNKYDKKYIHITTDCVFSGKIGNYDETNIHDAEDIYGITKSLGEDKHMCIIRTSIIGEEINNKNSLIEWVIKQKHSIIDGYENVFWNGVTCLQLAKIIEHMIKQNIYWNGVRHIFSPNIVSKYELCQYINDIYGLNISIHTKNIPCKNMTIKSIYKNDLNLLIPDIKTQIIEQHNYNLQPC